MRENKYRGKVVVGKSFVYGDLHKFRSDSDIAYIFTDTCVFEPVFRDTVGQFVGIPDKNDVEIYEGDIVISCGRKDIPCVVEYNQDRCEFVMRYAEDGILHLVKEFKNSYEVIGNIYDNPELLKWEQE